MKTRSLMRQIEAEGDPRKAAALLIRELDAKKTLCLPGGKLAVPDHDRRLAAVKVILNYSGGHRL
ncbi:MAG: hypothetical protein WC378_01280 [Opitutaceae bacterium]